MAPSPSKTGLSSRAPWPPRWRSCLAVPIAAAAALSWLVGAASASELAERQRGSDPLTGPRSALPKDWVGLRPLPANIEILLLAGHADAQGMAGSGTSGAAVALAGAAPMVPGITDEHYWNLVIAEAVERLGRQRGLMVRYHRPPLRTMLDGDAPGTNWHAGRSHAAAGGYALELHFDAYGPSGVGSGLIPALHAPFSRLDESLAAEFGAYPMNFRNRLGGPRRGISLLEIGKLEGILEASLRDPSRRSRTVQVIAERIVTAIERGLGRQPAVDGMATTGAAPGLRTALSPQPDGVGNAPPTWGR
jgi:hypothetical protein